MSKILISVGGKVVKSAGRMPLTASNLAKMPVEDVMALAVDAFGLGTCFSEEYLSAFFSDPRNIELTVAERTKLSPEQLEKEFEDLARRLEALEEAQR